MWEIPKCHFFSKLRQKAGLVVMKLKIWIKWFIISLIYIQDISQKFSVLTMFPIWRTDWTRMDFRSPLPLHTTHCFLFLTKSSRPFDCPKTPWRMSHSNEGCVHGFICHPSPEPRDEGAEPPGGWCDGRETGLFLLPSYSCPSMMIVWAQEWEFGGVKQINCNAIWLFQSQKFIQD